MNDEDDDLPLLTHILRTADGRAPSAHAGSNGGAGPTFDFDVHGFHETPPSPIVIGHEHPTPHRLDVAARAVAVAEPVIVADPRQTMRQDAFRLAQDVDGTDHAPMSIDEPAMVMKDASAEPRSAHGDTALDFSLPNVATRVREAVLDDLAVRIDIELDARIAQVIHAEIETALAQLQHSLRVQLGEALRDVVARAVDAEIVRMGRVPPDVR